MRRLVLRGFIRQQLQERLTLLWIGGFGKPLPKELEVQRISSQPQFDPL
jgi:hypothetical protein